MQLRDYQLLTRDRIYEYFYTHPNPGNPLAVLPTGAGKSVIIGDFCKDVIRQWPNQRIIMVTHVKELIQQNYEKLLQVWPGAEAGIYCASMNKRQHTHRVICASIQSIYKKAHLFGWRDLILIDECHLLSADGESMYQLFLSGLKQINPRLKVIGFTATPYRMKSGHLCEGKGALFTDIAHEVTITELLEKGYLSPLVSKQSATQADLSKVKTVGGEFNMKHAEEAMDKEAITEAAIREVKELAYDRKSWLFFCTGIGHAEHVKEAIRRHGIDAESIHSGTPKAERERIIELYKAGKIRALTNANVLTTGFDAPQTDCLVLLRPTKSVGLYVQIMGRGMRIASGKENCLVLDYAGNIERFGPVTAVIPPPPKKKAEKKNVVVPPTCIICPKCFEASKLYAARCSHCDYPFQRPLKINHETTASDLDPMGEAERRPRRQVVDVSTIEYKRHQKMDKPDSMRVIYHCGLSSHSEWVCFNHTGTPRVSAERWWKRRAPIDLPPPDNVEEALEYVSELAEPRQIEIEKVGKFIQVKGYVF